MTMITTSPKTPGKMKNPPRRDPLITTHPVSELAETREPHAISRASDGRRTILD